ncbi:MAG TPA: saccharopine dehydrogenase NADP-binding domain-containing protein, partial [Bacteroidales bacterium]|nr:saccharopine dehydrogenase NADP-binding domain-containing protein [Bacteroidales bacterium]
MQNIIVLGAGMVGSCIAIDMAKNHKVTLTDINRETLEKTQKKHNALNIRLLDVTDKGTLREIISDYDLVINAVPGFLGHETLRTVIEEGHNVVDIAFAPEDAM